MPVAAGEAEAEAAVALMAHGESTARRRIG
jgi:hypothetical protein